MRVPVYTVFTSLTASAESQWAHRKKSGSRQTDRQTPAASCHQRLLIVCKRPLDPTWTSSTPKCFMILPRFAFSWKYTPGLRCLFPVISKYLVLLFLSSQAGKSYEQLKEELGDAAAIMRITAVSGADPETRRPRTLSETAGATDTTGQNPPSL